MQKRYTVLTFIFNNYEVVHEIEEKDPEAEYLLITDDKDLHSESWTVIHDLSLDGLSPWAKCCAVRYNCFKYANTDICVRVDGSIKVKRSLKPLIDRLEEGPFDICLMPNPTFCNFLDEYEYWIQNRQYPRTQAERCINVMRDAGYDFSYKGYFQINFGIIRRSALTQAIDEDIFNEVCKWGSIGEPERLDQVPFSYILNTKYSDIKVLPISEQIICSAYLQTYGHNATNPAYLDKPFDIAKDDYQYLFNKKVKCEYIPSTNEVLRQRVTELWNELLTTQRSKWEEINAVKQCLNDEIARQNTEISHRDDEIILQKVEIAKRDKNIARQEQEIAKRDRNIFHLEANTYNLQEDLFQANNKLRYYRHNMFSRIIHKIFHKRKKVLIDLCQLDFPNCGFGQIALNYMKLFGDIQRAHTEDFDICFMLPDCMKGHPVDGVECYYENLSGEDKPTDIKVDLWHSVNQLCRVYPKHQDTKLIFTIHDYNFLTETSGDERKACLEKMQGYIDRSTAVTCISDYTARCVKENSNLTGKVVRTIYNGVEPLTNKPSQKPDFFIEGKEFFFAIGVFSPKKNFALLLDVMKSFPDKVLYICGNTDAFGTTYGKKIKERIKNENITNVIVPGPISDENRVWLFANCQAFLFPSIGEGFGLPAIEAMQFGKPVFASYAQCLPEVVGNNGYIWENFKIAYMVDVIKYGLNDFYLTKDKAERAKAYAATFSYRKHITEYLKLYRELLYKN